MIIWVRANWIFHHPGIRVDVYDSQLPRPSQKLFLHQVWIDVGSLSKNKNVIIFSSYGIVVIKQHGYTELVS